MELIAVVKRAETPSDASLYFRVSPESSRLSRRVRLDAKGHQHMLRPCRSTAMEAAEQMHLKALIFDCDGTRVSQILWTYSNVGDRFTSGILPLDTLTP